MGRNLESQLIGFALAVQKSMGSRVDGLEKKGLGPAYVEERLEYSVNKSPGYSGKANSRDPIRPIKLGIGKNE